MPAKQTCMYKEGRLNGTTPAEHPEALRVWLRMLMCTQLIETQVRARLVASLGTTLPCIGRFGATTALIDACTEEFRS